MRRDAQPGRKVYALHPWYPTKDIGSIGVAEYYERLLTRACTRDRKLEAVAVTNLGICPLVGEHNKALGLMKQHGAARAVGNVDSRRGR